MLQLLQSNRMSHLVGSFVTRMHASENPFTASTVVVQSFGMGQWLKLKVAEETGIAANIDCILPARLIWDLHRAVLTQHDLPTDNPFSVERMTWQLMRRLPNVDHASVRHFLAGAGDPQVRQFQLAEKIGALFDQYLIYRPHWIIGWESGDAGVPDSWQADLWRDLIDDPVLRDKPHRARLHQALLERLDDPHTIDGLPSQVTVFGLSSLPPLHLETLRALAEHIDVDIYFLNPCQHYWGDIVSPRDKARRSIRDLIGTEGTLSDADYVEVGNPLLSSVGRQGREFLELMLEIDEISIAELFEPATATSMLDRLKNDLLDLTFGGEFGALIAPTPAPVSADQANIHVHVCHSRMREVEVLYDQLLGMMKSRPDIELRDIIVMMPDVGEYAPFIEAVFKGEFSYSIADRSLDQESAVLVAFRTLLTLPDLRLTATEVMDLLEVPTVARRFELLDDDLATLTRWIDDSGIRWALDGAEKQERWSLPGDTSNSWRFGLDRVLLGLAMDERAGPFEGILPLPVNAADSELIGILCDVIDLLARYRAELSTPKPIAAWRDCILRLCDDFFDARGREELDLTRARDLIIDLDTQVSASGYSEPVSPRMVQFWFDRQLSISQQTRGFISGGITFATLIPMRSIPFKVVCLLGMNDGTYPREDRPVTFDLMQIEGRRRGDRSKRDDDRYLFLEALMAAEDFLYISYTGRGSKDNQARPPSVLVSELLDYCRQVFDYDPVIEHPLQPFGSKYYLSDYPRHVTFRSDWFEALQSEPVHKPFADVALDAPAELALSQVDQLCQFFRNPARYYLRHALGVSFDNDEEVLKDTEPFTLDGLERYQLADSALTALVNGTPIDAWQARVLASGQVLSGDAGAEQVQRQLQRAAMVYQEISGHLSAGTEVFATTIELDGLSLTGAVSPICSGRVLNYRSGALRKRQLLDAWIRHLFICAAGAGTETVLVEFDGDQAETSVIRPLAADLARGHLLNLAGLYESGISRPLPFMPETSFAWYSAYVENEMIQVADDRAMARWNVQAAGAEGQDRSFTRLFSLPAALDENFRRTAISICEPLVDAWSGK